MRCGSIIFATDSGLGVLARSFYDHGIVNNVLVVRHGRHETHDSWYPGAEQITNLRDPKQQQRMMDWCLDMDVCLFFETPFHWPLIDFCRSRRVKTALMPMYECTPEKLPAVPDLFLCPSLLDLQVMQGKEVRPDLFQDGKLSHPVRGKAVFIPVPVDVPWRQRTKAEVFVCNAGHGGLKGRNGVEEFMEAVSLHVKSPATFIIRSQKPLPFKAGGGDLPAGRFERDGGVTIDIRLGTFPHDQLYAEGDVLIHLTKWCGLSLPLQEARAAGMLVMCGDRFPMNTWLPYKVETTTEANQTYRTYRSPLIPVEGYVKSRVGPPYNEFDEAQFSPRAIAAKIDEWYGRDLVEYSQQGRAWAEGMSWEALGPKYRQTLEELCDGS